jgi:hypothetical protein
MTTMKPDPPENDPGIDTRPLERPFPLHGVCVGREKALLDKLAEVERQRDDLRVAMAGWGYVEEAFEKARALDEKLRRVIEIWRRCDEPDGWDELESVLDDLAQERK